MLSWSCGEWMNQMEGKEILKNVLNSNSFKVKTQQGSILQGNEKFGVIIKGLILSRDEATFPPELMEIKQKILDKINGKTAAKRNV